MTYFIRRTSNPEADLERGYSFTGYNLVASKADALKMLAEYEGAADKDDFNFDTWAEENEYRVAQDNVTSLWGIRRSGLCAYSEWETLEDAIGEIESGDYVYGGGHIAGFVVIFEGYRRYDQEMDGMDEGVSFRPQRIALVRESD